MASEEVQPVLAEASPEPVIPQGIAPKKPKRLTLQERLAAAAKAKKRKAEKASDSTGINEYGPPDAIPSSEPSTSVSEGVNVDKKAEEIAVSIAESGQVRDDSIKHEDTSASELGISSHQKNEESQDVASSALDTNDHKPENFQEETAPESSSQVDPISSINAESITKASDDGEKKTLEPTQASGTSLGNKEIDELKAEIVSLRAELAQQKKKAPAASSRVVQNKELDKKLVEKDRLLSQNEKKLLERETTIQQLMDEGQELSKKELKLNERIRQLVANNTKLETSLRSYAEKNEESLLKLGEIEDLIKVHKLKSVDQLFDVLAASNQKISDLQTSLDKQKDSNWEGKYKEMQRLYEKELDEKRDCKKQLSEVHVQLELLQNSSRLELQSKTDIISQLNREIMASKDESSTEVLRLESKIEGLRMENESFLKAPQKISNGDTSSDAAAHKSVDYVDFLKLSETHRNLQAQYVSSQENWKAIELSLHSKVEALAASVESSKKSRAKSNTELKKLHAELNAQLDQIEALKAELSRASEISNEFEFCLQMKCTECTELEEKLEELRSVFASDRKNYDAKIKTLNDTIKHLENQTPTFTPSVSYDNLSSIQNRRYGRDGGLQISIDPRQSVQRKFSSQSMASSAMNTPAQNWDNSSFISETEQDSQMYDNHNTSSISFNEEIYPAEALDVSETPHTPSLASLGAGATKHIQIINKMSASIRRLEVEISTLRDENEQLTTQKEDAQHAALNKFELDRKLEDLENRASLLQQELEEKSKREGTLLEVIGEKSEKVGELEADVADLKDLLRQQVQQMIEMQAKQTV